MILFAISYIKIALVPFYKKIKKKTVLIICY